MEVVCQSLRRFLIVSLKKRYKYTEIFDTCLTIVTVCCVSNHFRRHICLLLFDKVAPIERTKAIDNLGVVLSFFFFFMDSVSIQFPSMTLQKRRPPRMDELVAVFSRPLFVDMTATKRDIHDEEFLLFADFMLAAGSEDGPVRKKRRMWSCQQLIELMEME